MLDRASRRASASRISALSVVWAAIFLPMLIAAADARTRKQAPRPKPAASARLPATVPFPQPRPQADLKAAHTEQAPQPSTCFQRLADGLAVAKPIPVLEGPGACGATDVVRLDAVWTRAGRRVSMNPPAELRCSMAEAVVHWVRDDVAAALGPGQAPLAGVAVAASYDCRGRNNIKGAKLSQHGLANAMDVRAFKLADGKDLALTDKNVAKAFRTQMHDSACARFTTVLGPDSDGYHEDHIHLDLAERRSGYRICQWAVHTPADAKPTVVASHQPAKTPEPAKAPETAKAPEPTKAPVPAKALAGTRTAAVGVPMPVPAPRPPVAAGPKLKPLPLPEGRPGLRQRLRVTMRLRSPSPTARLRAKPPKRARAVRSASCHAARACPPTASRRRARASRARQARPPEFLRAIFRW